MALICCPECGKEVSDEAELCPSCGHFLKKKEKEKQKKKTMTTIALILGIISLIASFFFQEPFGKASTNLHGLPGYEPWSTLSLVHPVLVIIGIITIKLAPLLGSIIFFISAGILIITLPFGFFQAVILIIAGVLGIKSRSKKR